MKKILFVFVLFLSSITIFSGCKNDTVINNQYYEFETTDNIFKIVEVTDSYFIVYHAENKVMYAVSKGSYNYGNFTLLVDKYGLPLLYND